MRSPEITWTLVVGVLAGLVSGACGGGSEEIPEELLYGTPAYERDPALDVQHSSSSGANLSHNEGQNCMKCHQEYGPGKGRFTVAGTVAGPDGEWLENPKLELWDGPHDQGGSLVLELSGDARGNFYTTADLPMPETSLFVRVTNSVGDLEGRMPWPTSSGACNHCHVGRRPVRVSEQDPHGAAGAPSH